MADTTSYISKVNLKGTTYAIKDAAATTAISTVNSSVSSLQESVNQLSTKVTTAQTDISNIKKLSRLTASYDSQTETLNITEGTHTA